MCRSAINQGKEIRYWTEVLSMFKAWTAGMHVDRFLLDFLHELWISFT
jgi:hypothetical protein